MLAHGEIDVCVVPVRQVLPVQRRKEKNDRGDQFVLPSNRQNKIIGQNTREQLKLEEIMTGLVMKEATKLVFQENNIFILIFLCIGTHSTQMASSSSGDTR